MKTFKGTKREWIIKPIRLSKNISNALGAKIKQKGTDKVICTTTIYHHIEGKANAKLIAASKDLLEEHIMDLQHLKSWKKKLIDANLRGSILYEEYMEMIDAKEKVINKAL